MAIDRRFLDVSLCIEGIANEPSGTPAKGTQYIVGSSPTGAFAGASANSVARYTGSAWKFAKPASGQMELLNITASAILRWNGSAWETAASLGGEGGTSLAVESHALTESEASAKSFELANAVATGKETSVCLSVCGVVQAAGMDFTVSGKAVSWTDKGLASIGLVAGDVFVVSYEKA